MIPEQFKFKPVDTAILSVILEGHLDLTTYLIELLRTNKLEQQTILFGFPTPENRGKNEIHPPQYRHEM